jgi:hypothetical protein
MRTLGVGLLLIGIALVLVGLNMDTSVYSPGSGGVLGGAYIPGSYVNNTGLMQQQMLAVQAGLASLLGAVMAFGFSAVIDVLRPAAEPVSGIPADSEEMRASQRRQARIVMFAVVGLLFLIILFTVFR